MREVQRPLSFTDTAARALELGDAVSLSGEIFTGREHFYQQVVESWQFAIGTRPLFAQHAQIGRNLCPVMHLMLDPCKDKRQR
jgi:tartrate dehydratase beta subunit/fumarate hydratase class I family protein